MKKIFICLIGAIILFAWNAISWMGLPFHANSLKTIPDQAINFSLLQEELPEDGIYHYPGLDTKDMATRLANGPRIPFMVYIKGKTSVFDPSSFAKNFLFNLISATLLFILIGKLSNHSLSSILTSSLVIGLIVGFASDFPQMNWYMHPFSYTLINVFDYLIGFLLLGFFFSRFAFKKG